MREMNGYNTQMERRYFGEQNRIEREEKQEERKIGKVTRI